MWQLLDGHQWVAVLILIPIGFMIFGYWLDHEPISDKYFDDGEPRFPEEGDDD